MSARAAAVVVSLALVAAPRPAQACGGFFCSSTPIVQTQERIVYALESDGSLTMTVEVQYGGRDDDFAWILPVPTAPTISLGSAALLDALDAASAPTFGYEQRVRGVCRDYPGCIVRGEEPEAASCGVDVVERPTGYVDELTEPPPPVPEPPPSWMDGSVVIHGEAPVGPYESVTISANSASDVVAWLDAHGYLVPVQTVPLLEPYVAQGFAFVALRLAANRADGVLRPVQLRFPPNADGSAAEACLPLRLTAVASAATLGITAMFLAEAPVMSSNFSVVDFDPTDPVNSVLWPPSAVPWSSWVSNAVQPFSGQAFVIDYVGRTPAVALALPSVLDLSTESDPGRFVQALAARGYAPDAELVALFELYLPAPAGQPPASYYYCLAAGGACEAPPRFQPADLARSIDELITTPRAEGEAMVRRRPRMTRLSAVLTPAQMVLDPIFVPVPGHPDVARSHPAVLVTSCSDGYYPGDAPWELRVGEGSALDLRAGGVTIASSPGFGADPVEYCDRFGARPSGRPASERARLCGYRSTGCTAAGTLPAWAGLVSVLLVPVLVWHGRRAARARKV